MVADSKLVNNLRRLHLVHKHTPTAWQCVTPSILRGFGNWKQGMDVHPVCRIWVMRHWRGYLSGTSEWFEDGQLMPMPSSHLSSVQESYQLAQLVLEKSQLKWCTVNGHHLMVGWCMSTCVCEWLSVCVCVSSATWKCRSLRPYSQCHRNSSSGWPSGNAMTSSHVLAFSRPIFLPTLPTLLLQTQLMLLRTSGQV